MPRRRRGARTAQIEAEHSLAMRLVMHSPKDMVAGAFAFAAVIAIIANALFYQTGRHPSPMFGSVTVMPASALIAGNPIPRPRPAEITATTPETRIAEPKPAEKAVDPKTPDQLGIVVKSVGSASASSNVLRPPAPIPVSSHPELPVNSGQRRVAAVQRALTEYGYGQLKPTGTMGADTQAAIQKFERERRLAPTGQMSERLVRELTAVIGHPID
jgi:peptidoglycan hydrolase-like protein with peptidoglycan-binding domain